jgi:release factor glutamine methyltransferase
MDGLQPDSSRAAVLSKLAAQLVAAGCEDAATDARILVCAAVGVTRADLIRSPDVAVGGAALGRLGLFASRRAAGEPVSRILGRREFWGLPIALSPAVLDPRADTETLVDAVLAEFSRRRHAPLRILDLGVGSGAILCALLSEFSAATGVGVDLSPRAARQARDNLATCALEDRSSIIVGSWAGALRGRFDVVVSNPPYIASGAIDGLPAEVRNHDPVLALDGGGDGLSAYRAIAPALTSLLGAGGRVYLEVGAGQAQAVRAILAARGIEEVATYADLAGFERVVAGSAISA